MANSTSESKASTAPAPMLTMEEAAQAVATLRARIAEAVFGQESLVNETLCALLAGGHILMTGAPGLAKTTLVRVFARNLGLQFGRVQFTPDLLPSDIIGSEILNVDAATGRRSFEFLAGPVFVNLLLADEINRASPRTQSALLEAMQERSVTVAGTQHRLPQPFMVFATQNPFESEGTFPLPEAQMDRFLLHTLVDYPDRAAEEKIISAHVESTLVGESMSSQEPPPVLHGDQIRAVQARVRAIHVEHDLVTAMAELVRATRPQDPTCPESLRKSIWYGAGPRAGISLVSVCRALALCEGQESVRWSHVRRLAFPVLRHRIRLTGHAMRDSLTEDKAITVLLEQVEARHANLARGIG